MSFNYYVVVEGLEPGIYKEWDGGNGAWARVNGYSGAFFQGHNRLRDAIKFYKANKNDEDPILWFKQDPYAFFAIVEGEVSGIFNSWFGENGAYQSILHFHSPLFKGFHDLDSAKAWFFQEAGYEPELRFNNEQE